MSLVSYALTSLGKVKTRLGLGSSSASDDLITDLINEMTDFIERYCQRRFISTVYTDEEYDGTGTNELITKHYPLISVSSISYRGAKTDTWASVDSDFYYTYNDEGIISKENWVSGNQNYKITYTAGFVTIPYDLENACIKLVVNEFNNTKSLGIRSQSLGQYSVTFEERGDILNKLGIKSILDQYRTPQV